MGRVDSDQSSGRVRLLTNSRKGGRLKKATIVALARKLLVALWKYTTSGIIIEGAVMKPV